MDTPFSKDNSIVGNTFAHIFTDGWFVQIIPMRYKSEAGTKLERINWYIRVENNTFVVN